MAMMDAGQEDKFTMGAIGDELDPPALDTSDPDKLWSQLALDGADEATRDRLLAIAGELER